MQQSEKEKARIFNGRYVEKKRLSAGSFGVVYICQSTLNKEYVAVKVEKEGSDQMSLDREIQIIEELRGLQGVPKLYWYGQEYNCNCMAMQLLGRDLAYHLKKYRKFTLKCVCNLADQLLNVLEEVHKRGVIHRDIKPENILTGREAEINKIYVVDFGISKKYRLNGQHIPYQEKKPFIGTTRYASLAAHKGQELSRKDDLESLGYMFVFLLKGTLPWQNICSSTDKEKTKMVGKLKMSIDTRDLCKGLPSEIMRYMDYVLKLKFTSTPDYKYLIGLFHKCAIQNGFNIDRKFDWIEQGTTSTNSSDNQHVPHKETVNDMSSSMFMGSDYLKLPDLKRGAERRKSNNEVSSQQSSIFNNYVPSVVHNIGVQPHFKSRESSMHRVASKKSFKSRDSSVNRRHIQEVQELFYKGENFQDLEAREERNKQFVDDGEAGDDFDDDFFIDDDDKAGGLQQQLKKVGNFKYHFKDKLADK